MIHFKLTQNKNRHLRIGGGRAIISYLLIKLEMPLSLAFLLNNIKERMTFQSYALAYSLDFAEFLENLLRCHRPGSDPYAAGVVDCVADGRGCAVAGDFGDGLGTHRAELILDVHEH